MYEVGWKMEMGANHLKVIQNVKEGHRKTLDIHAISKSNVASTMNVVHGFTHALCTAPYGILNIYGTISVLAWSNNIKTC